MVSKDLTFNLFGRDVNASASLRRVARAGETTSRDIGRAFGGLPKMAALASAGVVAVSVKMASDFQSQMALLSSAAGEPAAKVKAIGAGVQQIAADTGTPLAQLTEGAYTVAKSFGKDGAAGQLDVLRASAEGAAAEHVDLGTATNALTSVMKGYGAKSSEAVKYQNQLIAASGLSKTTMQDFAGSLSSVVPLASALHVSFAQVGGAIATMTQHGETADNATQNLSNLLTNLAGQNNVASKAMQQLGINTIDLQKNLGKRGISGTLDIVENALAKSSKGGMVVVSSFRQSANATAALKSMLQGMSPEARSLSEEFQKGSLSYKDYTKSMKGLGGPAYAQAAQFKGLYLSSQGFNDALKSGNPNISTAASQLQHMLGGVTGMRTALMLGGNSAKGFKGAVDEISKAAGKGGKDVSSWGITSKTSAVQFARLRESLAVVGIAIGSVLLPALTRAASSMAGFFKGVSSGVGPARSIAVTVGVLVGALAGLYAMQKIANVVMFAGRAGLLLFRGALLAWSIATKVAAAAQLAFNLIMDANPVALIILAIIALIAIIVLLVTHWKQVCKFLQDVWGAVCKWFGDTLTTIGKWWSDTWNAIVRANVIIWNTIVGVVRTYLGHVHDTITGVITTIRDFFRNSATWLIDAGKHIIDGLVNGIKGAIGFVTDTVHNIADGVVGTFKNILGIHSPSTVFHNFGTNIGQGLTNGLLGTQKQVQAATNRLADTVIGMFEQRKGGISHAAERAALGTINSGTRTLEAEAARRAALIKQATTAEKRLTADLKAQRKARDTSITDSTTGAGNVTQFASAGAMVAGLAGLVARTRRFRTDLGLLVKKGIDQNTFKELIAAGVDGGGLQAAGQLLANPTDFREIVTMQRQLAAAGSSLGSLAGNFEYAPAVARDRARVATLHGAERVETWKMQKTAAGMIDAIARETHVHIHLSGNFLGSSTQIAKSVTDAIKLAVKQGHLPKNVLTAL